MSFDKFLQDLTKLENATYATGFDISKFYLSDTDILKNLLGDKIPGLSPDEIELMAEAAYGDSEEDIEEISEISREDAQLLIEQEKQERRLGRVSDQEILNRSRLRRLDKNKKEKGEIRNELISIYKESSEQFKKEVDELKDDVRNASFRFANTFIEVSKEFALALSKAATSLPGAVVMAVAPPWNVPGAVSSLLVVIVDYLDILAKIQLIVPYFEPLKKLPILVDKIKLNTVGKILDTITLALYAFYIPVLGLKKLIDKIFDFILSLFNNRRDKIFKQATKKLLKAGHLRRKVRRPAIVLERNDEGEITGGDLKLRDRGENRGRFELDVPEGSPKQTVTIYSYDEDDVDEILTLLNEFSIGGTSGKWGTKDKFVISYRNEFKIPPEVSVDGDASDSDGSGSGSKTGIGLSNNNDGDVSLESQINNIKNKLNDIDDILQGWVNLNGDEIDTSEFDQFVYDITLPDGSVIPNISEEGLEYYKNKFDLTIKDLII